MVVFAGVLALAHDFLIALWRFVNQRKRELSVILLQLQLVHLHVTFVNVARTSELLIRADHFAEYDYLLEQEHSPLFQLDLLVVVLLLLFDVFGLLHKQRVLQE